MKRIKLKDNLFFIDNISKRIYYFVNISETEVNGYSFIKNGKMEKGAWDKLEWIKIFKHHNDDRFNLVDDIRLTDKRKRNIIKSILNGEIK